jgi:uncharacterized protein YkwD
MKRLSLLTLTIMLALGCQRSEANPIDATQPTAIENESSSLARWTSCYDADEWTCEVEAAIARQTNEKRTGAPALTQLFESSYVARRHSNSMLKKNSVNHDGFQGRAAELNKEMPDLPICALGENVAMIGQDIDDPEQVAAEFVKMWWKSQGHHDNMINAQYKYIGVGVVRSGQAIYATQVFHGLCRK